MWYKNKFIEGNSKKVSRTNFYNKNSVTIVIVHSFKLSTELKIHIQSVRKDLLPELFQVYYWILFCTTHEHYYKKSLIKWNYIQKKIRGPA